MTNHLNISFDFDGPGVNLLATAYQSGYVGNGNAWFNFSDIEKFFLEINDLANSKIKSTIISGGFISKESN
jgi:hypothetical protein